MTYRLGALLLTGILYTMNSMAALQITDLRCEYKTNPLGIDVMAPRLGWELRSEAPGQVQSAWQILVASSPELLARDTGDLWDSGKVASDATAFIAYAGAPLGSRDRCFWKVRVWDGGDAPSPWSATALWTVGLLEPEDWSAEWIGYDAASEEGAVDSPALDMGNAQWIWYPEGDPASAAPVGEVAFRTVIDVEAGRPIRESALYLTADNWARPYLNGAELEGTVTDFNQVMRIDLSRVLKPGANTLAILADNKGDAPNPAGLIARVVVDYVDGDDLVVESGPGWKAIRDDRPADWYAPGLDESGWANALAIGPVGTPPWPVPALPAPTFLPPPPQLRAAFEAKPGIARATLYATAFGIYDAFINGERVGDFIFAPGFTDYHKRLYYQTYDVTGLVRAGEENVFAALLGDGWYAGYLGFLPQLNVKSARDHYGDAPRFRGQLEIEYTDGTTETVATDGSWKAAYGHIREADMLMGEFHDYHLATAGWMVPGFDDSDWASVVAGDTPHDVPVQAHPGTPVTRHEHLPAVSVKEIEPGVFIYDLGQNIAGWAQIRLAGKAGQRVQVRHGERLDGDGTLYTTNLRKARCIDVYTLAEDGPVTLEPHFTFHGFQYVEITGVDAAPAPEDVAGVVLQSVIEPAGHFECSEPLLNQLFQNIVWGQKGNYLEIPTDCPQRDERMGWTGDAQFFMPTALYNMDCGAFFTKWLVDLIQDSQLDDGSFADVAPHVALGGGAVAWGDAAMICTYEMYRYYGDTAIIRRHFPNLVRGMEFLESTSEGGIRSKMGYGDWLNKGGGAKDEVICTAYFAYLAGLMEEMATAIGDAPMAKHYAALRERVKAAFIENFVDAEGKILESSQTGYALAFTMDLLPEDRKALAAEQFAGEIARFDNHLATGFIGTPRLLPGLAAAGKIDLAYELLLNTGYPSWLFQVTQGATTMWERWDGWTPEEGFQDPGMNSFNHYAFGAVGEWLYRTIGGIAPTEPGFKRFDIAPRPGGGLTWANTHYRSIHGLIRSEWRIDGDTFTLAVEIPVNTVATVRLPDDFAGAVTLDGDDVGEHPRARYAADGDTGRTVELGSGVYTLRIGG